MFEDYKTEVLAFYHRKLEDATLSGNLVNPTPALIKKECEIVYQERHSDKDLATLRSFFGSSSDRSEINNLISVIDIDRFKPLQQVLKGKINQPRNITIEVLAWLINFDNRPYSIWNKNRLENQQNKIETVITQEQNKGDLHLVKKQSTDENVLNSSEIKQAFNGKQLVNVFKANSSVQDRTIDTHIGSSRFKIKISFVVFLFISVVFGAAYLFSKDSDQQCMYWTGDHYQAISCNKKVGKSMILAYDSLKVFGQKKITRPDTLTAYAIHRIWYAKVNGEIEFFTSGGEYPGDPNKRLLPVSAYILNKYAR